MIVNVRTRQLQVEGSTRTIGKRQCSAGQAGMVGRVSWHVRVFYTEERENVPCFRILLPYFIMLFEPKLHGRMESKLNYDLT
jgi:hypothetical protein